MNLCYMEIRDSHDTKWYASDSIRNIADGAALLNKAIEMAPDPDISTVEQCGGAALRAITEDEYKAALEELPSAGRKMLVAEVDLDKDECRFTYRGRPQSTAHQVCSSVSRLTGIYAMAYDRSVGSLNEDNFVEGLLQHCHVAQVYGPGGQTPRSPAQGMTMA